RRTGQTARGSSSSFSSPKPEKSWAQRACDCANWLASLDRKGSVMPEGAICYLEIPAADAGRSAAFYASVFGWKSRTRGDGSRAFDDASGAVSGAWVVGRPAAREAGVGAYALADSLGARAGEAAAAGGGLVPPAPERPP